MSVSLRSSESCDTKGLTYLHNRYHDPGIGVFLSVDPLVAKTGEPYLYAGGNPATLSDPSGLTALPGGEWCGCQNPMISQPDLAQFSDEQWEDIVHFAQQTQAWNKTLGVDQFNFSEGFGSLHCDGYAVVQLLAAALEGTLGGLETAITEFRSSHDVIRGGRQWPSSSSAVTAALPELGSARLHTNACTPRDRVRGGEHPSAPSWCRDA